MPTLYEQERKLLAENCDSSEENHFVQQRRIGNLRFSLGEISGLRPGAAAENETRDRSRGRSFTRARVYTRLSVSPLREGSRDREPANRRPLRIAPHRAKTGPLEERMDTRRSALHHARVGLC